MRRDGPSLLKAYITGPALCSEDEMKGWKVRCDDIGTRNPT